MVLRKKPADDLETIFATCHVFVDYAGTKPFCDHTGRIILLDDSLLRLRGTVGQAWCALVRSLWFINFGGVGCFFASCPAGLFPEKTVAHAMYVKRKEQFCGISPVVTFSSLGKIDDAAVCPYEEACFVYWLLY